LGLPSIGRSHKDRIGAVVELERRVRDNQDRVDLAATLEGRQVRIETCQAHKHGLRERASYDSLVPGLDDSTRNEHDEPTDQRQPTFEVCEVGHVRHRAH